LIDYESITQMAILRFPILLVALTLSVASCGNEERFACVQMNESHCFCSFGSAMPKEIEEGRATEIESCTLDDLADGTDHDNQLCCASDDYAATSGLCHCLATNGGGCSTATSVAPNPVSSCTPSGGGPGVVSGWALGSWFAPEYQSPDGYSPPMGLIFSDDGTWTHSTNGQNDGAGSWSMSGGDLVIDGETMGEVLENCRSFKFAGAWQYIEYHNDAFSAACPNSPAPLTAQERCLLGDFEASSSSSANSSLSSSTFTEDRTLVSLSVYESVSDETFFTNVYNWKIAGGEVVLVDVSGYEVSSPLDIASYDAARTTATDAGCSW